MESFPSKSESKPPVYQAIDRILEEVCKYDEDRQSWVHERQRLNTDIDALKKELETTKREYDSLAKRHRILQLSLRHLRQESKSDEPKPDNITIKYKRKNRKTRHAWSATLPASLDPKKMVKLFSDIGFPWKEDHTPRAVTALAEQKSDPQDSTPTLKRDDSDKKVPEVPSKQGRSPDAKRSKHKPMMKAETENASPTKQMFQPKPKTDAKVKVCNSVFKSHFDAVRTLCFHSSENFLITGGDDGLIKFWNADVTSQSDNITPLITLRSHKGIITSTCVLDYHNMLLTAGEHGSLFAWNLEAIQQRLNPKNPVSLKSLGELQAFQLPNAHRQPIWGILPHPYETDPFIATLSSDNYLRIFDVTKQECVQIFSDSKEDQEGIRMCTGAWYDENSIIVGMSNGHARIFDTRTERLVNVIKHDQKPCVMYSMCHSPDVDAPHMFYAGYEDCRIRSFDMKMMKCSRNLKCHTDAVTAITLNVDSNVLMSASHDGRVRLWDLDGFTCVQDIEPQHTHRTKWEEGILCLQYEPRLSLGASGGADGNVLIYKLV